METPAKIREFEQSFNRLVHEYPERPKRVYLASCYRSARGEFGVDQYIAEARPVARAMWKLGLAVICPVMNTAFLGGSDIPTDVWLRGDFQMIRVCDAIVMHPNWESSVGAHQERDVAHETGIPVFYLPQHWRKLAAWAKKEVSCST